MHAAFGEGGSPGDAEPGAANLFVTCDFMYCPPSSNTGGNLPYTPPFFSYREKWGGMAALPFYSHGAHVFVTGDISAVTSDKKG